MKIFLLIFIIMIPVLNISPQTKRIATGLYIVISKDSCSSQKDIYKIKYRSDTLCIKSKPIITVKDIESCFTDSTKLDNKEVYALNIKLKYLSAKKFKTVTEKNVGKTIAFIIDKEVAMAVLLRDPITTGRLTVSGESGPKLKELGIKLNKEIRKYQKTL